MEKQQVPKEHASSNMNQFVPDVRDNDARAMNVPLVLKQLIFGYFQLIEYWHETTKQNIVLTTDINI